MERQTGTISRMCLGYELQIEKKCFIMRKNLNLRGSYVLQKENQTSC